MSGRLTLAPLELVLAEGRIAAELSLDGREEVPVMAGDVTVEGLDINAPMALLGEEGAAAGLLQGRIKLNSRGGSMRALGANANGEGALIMSGGRIENLIPELIALDLQEAAGQWLTGDDSTVEVLCLAHSGGAAGGRLRDHGRRHHGPQHRKRAAPLPGTRRPGPKRAADRAHPAPPRHHLSRQLTGRPA